MKKAIILRHAFFLVLIYSILACSSQTAQPDSLGVQLIVLGIAQDAGSPQIGCEKSCCAGVNSNRMVGSLALYDPMDSLCILFDATPDITAQMKLFQSTTGASNALPDAIFLTHAHMGHYTGLMYLGRESAGTDQLKVFAMPRMKSFLKTNGPWSMLVEKSYIQLQDLQQDSTIRVNDNISITPIQVPHRDEYSETVGFIVEGPSKKLLYIPDIDKWGKWDRNINQLISRVDIAFLDGTFYDSEELPGRDMSEIPHPFISESLSRFKQLKASDHDKIHFIHLNHTNPALSAESDAYKVIINSGFHVAIQGSHFPL